MRKLATIRKIQEIKPIVGADRICVYRVDDWWVVDNVDKYSVGDLAIYCEVDSWVPHEYKPELSKGHAPRVYEGVAGERLKTIRLRGQISQGLLLSTNILGDNLHEFLEGEDVSDLLRINKWEAVIPAELAGQASGNFPSFIKKTDQERCQNLYTDIFVHNINSRYEVTMKLDGTSFTGFYKDLEDGVCSRNWMLELGATNEHNAMVRMYIDSKMQDVLRIYGKNIAIQGELMGPNIQRNREGLTSVTLYVFDIYDIDNSCQLNPTARKSIMSDLYSIGLRKDLVKHVPLLATDVTLEELGIASVANLLADADGPSLVHPVREGKVYKRMDGCFSFKAISDSFLLKEKD